MLGEDVFYKNFRKVVLGIQDHDVDEKKDGKQDEVEDGIEGKNDNENGGNIVNAADNDEQENDQNSERVSFLVHQVDIVPLNVRNIYCNMMRSYPSSPLYLYLTVGSFGTNIARYSAVRRLSAHVRNVLKTGSFYM